MAIYRYCKAPIYPYYKILTDFLIEQRSVLTSDDQRIAINLSIILNTTCYIEGVLETKAKSIVEFFEDVYQKVEIPEFEIRKPINVFFHAMTNDLEDRISKSTGVEKYDDFFKLLLKKSFQEEPKIQTSIEAIKTLFQLRNVIAHSREVSAYERITNYETQRGDEYFFGGYKKAENLLLKEGIISQGFVESGNEALFFSDTVADYFVEKAEQFLCGIDKFVQENLSKLSSWS